MWLVFIGLLALIVFSFWMYYTETKERNDPEKVREKQREEAQRQQRQREIQAKRQELMKKGIISCPACASTAITSVRSPRADTFAEGYSWAREISGGCTVINVCQNCGHRFYPGV